MDTDFIIRIILQARDNFSATFNKVVGDVDRAVGDVNRRIDESTKGGLFSRIFGDPKKKAAEAKQALEEVTRAEQRYQQRKLREARRVAEELNRIEEETRRASERRAAGAERWVAWRAARSTGAGVPQAPGGAGARDADRAGEYARRAAVRAVDRESGGPGKLSAFAVAGAAVQALEEGAIGATKAVSEIGPAAIKAAGDATTAMNRLGAAAGSAFESVGKIAPQIMVGLITAAIALLPVLITGVLGLVGALVALASSAAMAGAAIGGAFVAGMAQAIPVIGLLIAAFARFKAVLDISGQQAELHQGQLAGATEALDRQRAAAQGVVRAHEALRDAQRNLVDSRREAARQLQDLVLQEKSARLAAEASSLSVEDAQIRLRRALRGGDVHELREARIAVKQATLGGAEAALGASRAGEDLARLGPKGIEGQQQVIQAQRQLRDATWALAAAQREAAKAAAGQSSALSQLNQAIKNLSSAEKGLLAAINRLKEVWKTATRPITDIMVRAFTDVTKRLTGIIADPKNLAAFTSLAQSVSGAIRSFFGALTTPEMMNLFRGFISEAATNVPIIAKAMGDFFTFLARVATAAAPVFKILLDAFAGWMASLAESSGDRQSLSNFFASAGRHLQAWLDLAGAIGGLFAALVGSAAQSGLGLVQDMTSAVRDWTTWIKDHRPEVQEFFDDAVDIAKLLWNAIVDIAQQLAKTFDKDTFQSFMSFLQGVIDLGGDIMSVLEGIGRFFGWIQDANDWWSENVGTVRDAFRELGKSVQWWVDHIVAAWNWITEHWSDLGAILWAPFSWFGDRMGDLWDAVISPLQAAWDRIAKIFGDAWHWIDENVFGPMRDAWQWILDHIPFMGQNDERTRAATTYLQNLPGSGGGVTGVTPIRAAGGREQAKSGGRPILVAEGGYDEYIISTDPKYKTRSLGLISQVLGKLGEGFAPGGKSSDVASSGVAGLTVAQLREARRLGARGALSQRGVADRAGMYSTISWGGHSSEVHPAIKALIYVLQKQLGVVVTSTRDHDQWVNTAPGEPRRQSSHWTGEAADVGYPGNDMAKLAAASDWIMGSGLYTLLRQGINNPKLSVQDGKAVSSSHWGEPGWSDHLDHIHVAAHDSNESGILSFLGRGVSRGTSRWEQRGQAPRTEDLPGGTAPILGGFPSGGVTYTPTGGGGFRVTPTVETRPMSFEAYFQKVTGNKSSRAGTKYLKPWVRSMYEKENPTVPVRGGGAGAGGTQTASEVPSGGGAGGSLDRVFPSFIAGTPGAHEKLTPQQVFDLAVSVGLPGRQMEQIAHGESSYYPGVQQRDPGDGMVGYGLWQMTPNSWGAAGVAKMNELGGIPAMFNPYKNALMAKYLYDSAGRAGNPLSPWYGTQYLTRAEGGELPGREGEPVTITAHVGEMILNRAQQAKLGGTAFLRNLFGFAPGGGPSFKEGGIAGASKTVSANIEELVAVFLSKVKEAITKTAVRAIPREPVDDLGRKEVRHAVTSATQENRMIQRLSTQGPGGLGLDLPARTSPKRRLHAQNVAFAKLLDTATTSAQARLEDIRSAVTDFQKRMQEHLAGIAFSYNKAGNIIVGSQLQGIEGELSAIASEHQMLLGEQGTLKASVQTARQALHAANLNLKTINAKQTPKAYLAAKAAVETANSHYVGMQTRQRANTVELDKLAAREFTARQAKEDFEIGQAQHAVDRADAELGRLEAMGASDQKRYDALTTKVNGMRGVRNELQQKLDSLPASATDMITQVTDQITDADAAIAQAVQDQAALARQIVNDAVDKNIAEAERGIKRIDLVGGLESTRIALVNDYIGGLREKLAVTQRALDDPANKDNAELLLGLTATLEDTRDLISTAIQDQAHRAFEVLQTATQKTLGMRESDTAQMNLTKNIQTGGTQTVDYASTAFQLAHTRGALMGERNAPGGLRDQLDAAYSVPVAERDQTLIDKLEAAMVANTTGLLENTIASRDNARAARDFAIAVGKNFMDQVVGLTSSLARGAELAGNTEDQKKFLKQGLDAMKVEAARQKALQPTWDAQFAAGTMTFEEWSANTKGLIDLNNTITETNQLLEGLGEAQSFASLTWQWFRQAVFTGSGGLLPGFVSAATGGSVTKGGLVNLHAGEIVVPAGGTSNVGGDTHVNLNITNPTETADPIYLGQRIAWEMRVVR